MLAMVRHLVPRAEWDSWGGPALTRKPSGGVLMPVGPIRAWRQSLGLLVHTPEFDDIKGGVLTVQWLGLMIEVAIGGVR